MEAVLIPTFGISAQATNSSFWNDTNGAVEGVLYQPFSGPNVAVTPKTVLFVKVFKAKYGNFPSDCGYTAYDEVYYITDAIKRADSTDPEKLVDALEKTNYVGTIGHSPNTHALKVGSAPTPSPVSLLQWQDGKQVNL
jgi:branched-chain amino acid transport system substrate-binding protein